MLVLSRRRNDKILFPNLGITIEILKLDGRSVRVGIQAPKQIDIRRQELDDRGAPVPEKSLAELVDLSKTAPSAELDSLNVAERDRQLRERVHLAALALNELNSRLEVDQYPELEDAMFKMFFELKSLDEEIDRRQKSLPPAAEPPKRTALLVEDNVNECRLLAGYLRCREFNVSVAHEGKAALSYLEDNEQPDVVLLDMNMPGIDGPSTVREIRQRRELEGLTILAVSGEDPAYYGVEVGPEGVDGWFPKPLDPESLVFRLAVGADKAPA